MSSIYTCTGDEGETSLRSSERIAKHSLRVEAYGTVDELQAFLGVARSFARNAQTSEDIKYMESKLVDVMSELADPQGAVVVSESDVQCIERLIDRYAGLLPEEFRWVLPGESRVSAFLHVSRTIARRAERVICELNFDEGVNQETLKLMNRLSDLCYVLARFEDEAA